jgi:acyl-CoA thioesterase-2
VYRSLAQELAVEPVGEDVFQARLGGWEGRSFGGATLGCAVHAAAHTCDGRSLHSLHAYFLKRIPPEVAIEFRVERLSEGRRVAHRRVQVCHQDRVLCEVTAGFSSGLAGASYQDVQLGAEVPRPEALMPDVELAKILGWEGEPPPVEWRWLEYPERERAPGEPPICRGWARPRVALGGDERLHAAGLAYLTDWASQGAVQRRFWPGFAFEGFASLDHALWVHRPARWDDWWLITAVSEIAAGGRAFTRREIYTQKGELIASAAQEALVAAAEGPGSP